MVGTLGTITGGSGGTAGTYGGVALTGGSGSGATANITVAGGAVTAVTILNPGSQYVVADVLSAASGTIGGTAGFSVPVASVAINSSLAGGTVGMYVPNTLTFKQTWFNADQTVAHQNTNPVTLDANGCAVIFGTGSYRQILKDSLSNTVWDQVTTDTSANNSVFWAGIAGGTPNAITVVDPGFNATDGSTINFVANATNTGSATLNPSGFGAIPIQKSTTSGPSNLTGGEITIGNIVSVIYSASFNTFTLVAVPPATGSTSATPLCGVTNLQIANDGTLPNIKIGITADAAVMNATSGAFINRQTVSVSVNTTTSGAGGLDTGALAATTWYYIWLIDNGTAPSALISLSASAPTMPSGYSYKCRIGTTIADGSSNLLRLFQRGNVTQYKVTAATNVPTLPIMASVTAGGTAGNISVPTWVAISVQLYIPPTAREIDVVLSAFLTAANRGVIAAPNDQYGNYINNSNPPTLTINQSASSAVGGHIKGRMTLESSNIYWAADPGAATGTGSIAASGWVDTVNAN